MLWHKDSKHTTGSRNAALADDTELTRKSGNCIAHTCVIGCAVIFRRKLEKKKKKKKLFCSQKKHTFSLCRAKNVLLSTRWTRCTHRWNAGFHKIRGGSGGENDKKLRAVGTLEPVNKATTIVNSRYASESGLTAVNTTEMCMFVHKRGRIPARRVSR